MKKMTRIEALVALLRDAAADRGTVKGYLRVNRACHSLDLSAEEAAAVFAELNYADNAGNLRAWIEGKV